MFRLFRRRRAPEDMAGSYLIAGLGNIGAEYAGTRHNIGFMVLDAWAQASNTVFLTRRYGDMAELSWKGRKLNLLKPSTYMNLSGNAVRYWMQKLHIPVSNVIVVCDDLNLEFGRVRMRLQGSSGGHNGLKSVEECLGTAQYTRIRVGIGNDFERGAQVDFVLGKLSEEQRAMMPEISGIVIQGVKDYCTAGPDRAMDGVNSSRITAANARESV